MFYDFTVKIPSIKGKIFHKKYSGHHYIHYQYENKYNPEKKYAEPKRTTIGKVCEDDETLMYPNQNYYKFFPSEAIPEETECADRSGCLKIGTYVVIDKVMKESGIRDIIRSVIGNKYGLFLDLIAYSIICEDNAAQYYPDYAYNHPLFTENMKIYSDSTISDFLHDMTDDDKIDILNAWNQIRNVNEKIYISYDSTNKKCQAGDIELIEAGHSKNGQTDMIFNTAIAYDSKNGDPLLYEEYPGSIVDISQLQCMIQKVNSFGYTDVGFVLDRGYFSDENIHYMDKNGYSFIMMIKGCKSIISDYINRVSGTFEKNYSYRIGEYETSGITVEGPLLKHDIKNRYIHIYYNDKKAASERDVLEKKIQRIEELLKKHYGTQYIPSKESEHYFDIMYYHEGEEDRTFQCAVPRTSVINKEVALCGYFAIVTSEQMSARDALLAYKSRDASEKLFRADKSFLGDSSSRVHSTESMKAKILIEFVALIVRNRIYRALMDEMEETGERRNYMTVPAAVRELEKIEIIRYGSSSVYRQDHAVTKTQKTILKAFDIDANYMKAKIEELSQRLGFKDIRG